MAGVSLSCILRSQAAAALEASLQQPFIRFITSQVTTEAAGTSCETKSFLLHLAVYELRPAGHSSSTSVLAV
eukprot:18799-Heterococcus_DN1.PRE.2